jgi:hypothetical protein
VRDEKDGTSRRIDLKRRAHARGHEGAQEASASSLKPNDARRAARRPPHISGFVPRPRVREPREPPIHDTHHLPAGRVEIMGLLSTLP